MNDLHFMVDNDINSFFQIPKLQNTLVFCESITIPVTAVWERYGLNGRKESRLSMYEEILLFWMKLY